MDGGIWAVFFEGVQHYHTLAEVVPVKERAEMSMWVHVSHHSVGDHTVRLVSVFSQR